MEQIQRMQENLLLIEKGNLVSPSILAGSASREAVSREFIRTVAAANAAVSLLPIPTALHGAVAGTLPAQALLSTKMKAKKTDCSGGSHG